MQNKLGIIILNYNTYEETVCCVSSIRKYTGPDYKIYIVDNCSVDGSFDRLKNEYRKDGDIFLIQAEKNNGYSAGNNIGIKIAEQEGCNIIYIINSDVELLNDALGQMTDTLLSNPDYMMVGPSVLLNNSKQGQLPRKKQNLKTFVLERHPFCYFSYFRKKAIRKLPLPVKGCLSFNGSVSGCCFGTRTEDFARIGYLDENVFLYSEEDIMAYKMDRLHKQAVVNMDAKVRHRENTSTKKEGLAFTRFYMWTSPMYLLRQYADIGKCKLGCIALWNTLTWTFLSTGSEDYRKLLKKFWNQNWKFVFRD